MKWRGRGQTSDHAELSQRQPDTRHDTSRPTLRERVSNWQIRCLLNNHIIICWKRLSLSSPLDELIRRPRALRKSTAELIRTPVFSTAIGWKRYDCDNTEYLLMSPSLPRCLPHCLSHCRVHTGVRQKADSRCIPSQGFAGLLLLLLLIFKLLMQY